LLQSSKLNFQSQDGSSLVLPHTKKKTEIFQSLPCLNDEEKSLYQDMGKVMMYCKHTLVMIGKEYLTGCRFSDALFSAILCLTAEEIDTPFERLSLETQL